MVRKVTQICKKIKQLQFTIIFLTQLWIAQRRLNPRLPNGRVELGPWILPAKVSNQVPIININRNKEKPERGTSSSSKGPGPVSVLSFS